MILIHPTQLHSPAQILRLQLATGLRATTHQGRAVLREHRREAAPEEPVTDVSDVSDYIGDPPRGAA